LSATYRFLTLDGLPNIRIRNLFLCSTGWKTLPLQSQLLTARAGQAEERIQQEKEQEEVQKQEV
jgi:hypothetical protein